MPIEKNDWNLGEKTQRPSGYLEKAVLIGVVQPPNTEEKINEYMDELAFLAETAGAIPMKRFTQKMQHTDSKTFIGSGKVQEIGKYVDNQKEHHKKKTFREEYLDLLREFDVEYDDRYLFEFFE